MRNENKNFDPSRLRIITATRYMQVSIYPRGEFHLLKSRPGEDRPPFEIKHVMIGADEEKNLHVRFFPEPNEGTVELRDGACFIKDQLEGNGLKVAFLVGVYDLVPETSEENPWFFLKFARAPRVYNKKKVDRKNL